MSTNRQAMTHSPESTPNRSFLRRLASEYALIFHLRLLIPFSKLSIVWLSLKQKPLLSCSLLLFAQRFRFLMRMNVSGAGFGRWWRSGTANKKSYTWRPHIGIRLCLSRHEKSMFMLHKLVKIRNGEKIIETPVDYFVFKKLSIDVLRIVFENRQK